MTSDDFCAWLDAMRAAKLARSDADCGRLLGVMPNTVVAYKRKGASRVVALACRALMHRMEGWGE